MITFSFLLFGYRFVASSGAALFPIDRDTVLLLSPLFTQFPAFISKIASITGNRQLIFGIAVNPAGLRYSGIWALAYG